MKRRLGGLGHPGSCTIGFHDAGDGPLLEPVGHAPGDRPIVERHHLDFAVEGQSGVMAALRSERIVAVPLSEAVDSIRGVPERLYETAQTFFG